MAKRVTRILPGLADRLVVRHHPVAPGSVPRLPRDQVILCPVLFSPYKGMVDRISELLAAIDQVADDAVRLLVTADRAEVPETLAANLRLELLGRLSHQELRERWARSRAIYFPPGVESFEYPTLAEARVSGQPVIAPDSELNREVAGPALCGFTVGDPDSLGQGDRAKRPNSGRDPGCPLPFDPTAYFDWLLGPCPS